MKKYLLLSIVFAIFVSIFSIEGIAQNATDIQVTIKMRNLGFDPSSGGTKTNITITTNKIGNLVYVEDYYSSNSYGQPNFYSGNRYEVAMNGYIVSFDLKRPNNNHWQAWSLVKSKILLDGVIVYDTWTGTSGTYKSFGPDISTNKNNSVASAGKMRSDQRLPEQFVDPVHDDSNANDTNNVGNIRPMYNITNLGGTTQKTPAIGIPVIIIVILSVYMFKRMNK